MGMRVVVVEDAGALARVGAAEVAAALAALPSASVVPATGRTPIGVYQELAARRRAGTFDTSRITAIQLDEYVGVDATDDRSLFGWMARSFLEPLGIDGHRVVPLPNDGDAAGACASFDRQLEERGGIDLAILGIGVNGHLGFNEPPSGGDTGSRVVDLLPETIEANATYWNGGDVPRQAVTMGLRQLLAARRILLLAAGVSKRAVTRPALEGPITPELPASFLQRAAGAVTAIVDQAAWDGAA
jgi:glucosamine-6-phosphate deaminase